MKKKKEKEYDYLRIKKNNNIKLIYIFFYGRIIVELPLSHNKLSFHGEGDDYYMSISIDGILKPKKVSDKVWMVSSQQLYHTLLLPEGYYRLVYNDDYNMYRIVQIF
jgi:hypothetical protein